MLQFVALRFLFLCCLLCSALFSAKWNRGRDLFFYAFVNNDQKGLASLDAIMQWLVRITWKLCFFFCIWYTVEVCVKKHAWMKMLYINTQYCRIFFFPPVSFSFYSHQSSNVVLKRRNCDSMILHPLFLTSEGCVIHFPFPEHWGSLKLLPGSTQLLAFTVRSRRRMTSGAVGAPTRNTPTTEELRVNLRAKHKHVSTVTVTILAFS